MPATHQSKYALTRDAVRWGIDTLGAQRLHPTFVMYLYLRRESLGGRLATASASSNEVLSLIRMPGNPSKPYYFPLIDRGSRDGNPLSSFWRSKNIPGSWSPGSIVRQKHGAWMSGTEGSYTLPNDASDRALSDLLFGEKVSALALAAYFLRNDHLHISGQPSLGDLIAAFRMKFDFSENSTDFDTLFVTGAPDVGFQWFEQLQVSSDEGEQSQEEDVHA